MAPRGAATVFPGRVDDVAPVAITGADLAQVPDVVQEGGDGKVEPGHERHRSRVDRRAALGLLAGARWHRPRSRSPALAVESGNDAAAAGILEALLERNLLPFWRRVAGPALGRGLRAQHRRRRQSGPPSNRAIIAQARTTWSFSRLARSGWGRPADLALARHGFEYLTRRMWDPEHGGFFWVVRVGDHEPIRPDKYLNGQAHALLALSEYALAARSAEARAWAERAADAIDDHLRDVAAGDYVDFRNRDWSAPPPDRPGYTGLLPGVRAYNARFRLLDALTVYHELKPTRRARPLAGGDRHRRAGDRAVSSTKE